MARGRELISVYASVLGARGGRARGNSKRRPVIRCSGCGHPLFHHRGLDGGRVCLQIQCVCREGRAS